MNIKQLNLDFTFKAPHNLCVGQSLTSIIRNKHVIFHFKFLLIISDERNEIENTHNILASQSVVFFYRHHLLMTSHQPIKPTMLNARFSCGQNICKCIFVIFCCCCILSLTISFAEHLIKESSLLLIIYLDYKTNTNNKNNRISVLR